MASNDLVKKSERLRETVRSYGSALVAYSGGVDSTFLLKVAVETLGRDKVVGVTARSESLTERSFNLACEVARTLDLPQEIIEYSELAIEGYADNPVYRCYYCKSDLFGRLKALAQERGLAAVLEGSNADDVGDFRPGMRASAELGMKSPLREVGLTKNEIRTLAREMGLPNWDRPSEACLASRFPYGELITHEKLSQVGEAENYIRDLGVRQVRVRHHGKVARIEVLPDDMPRLLDAGVREGLVAQLKNLGFDYVSLDLQGYRTGSMNEPLALASEGRLK
ncbi:ATP-dependent sacrificial sulfur transferase LarE [Candidatus Sumerlaeota bacterium]|nr:ATP-dependent sacrificial sulfur transferase LarE [Candidatus Sumerlaeota bacterium]